VKTVIFSEDQFPNIDEIGKSLFSDEQDPRSSAYKRVLVRPEINWLRIIIYIVIPVFIVIVLALVLKHFKCPLSIIVVSIMFFLIGYFLFTGKKACICAIKIYQRYAREALRNKCRFEPSCSEYMILSIEKYGIFKGVKKGVGRLRRCNINHGGYDLP